MELYPKPGSRALVAGGCGGIGRALVKVLVEHDIDVAILDHPAAFERYPAQDGALGLPADAQDPVSLRNAFGTLARRWESLDIFVFLIGVPILPPKPAPDLTELEWDRLMAINLRAAWLCSSLALPLLHHSKSGVIVTVSSSLAFNPNRGFSAYVASKGGIVSLTKALAMENAPTVRANVVAPSAVDTEFLDGGLGVAQQNGEWFRASTAAYVSGIPLARLASPEDVVGPIMFLAGPGSGYMTGQVVHVNGGRITP